MANLMVLAETFLTKTFFTTQNGDGKKKRASEAILLFLQDELHNLVFAWKYDHKLKKLT